MSSSFSVKIPASEAFALFGLEKQLIAKGRLLHPLEGLNNPAASQS